jgi:hypothetical protein
LRSDSIVLASIGVSVSGCREPEAGLGREADGEVQVGAALFEHGFEEGIDGGHGLR